MKVGDGLLINGSFAAVEHVFQDVVLLRCQNTERLVVPKNVVEFAINATKQLEVYSAE